MVVFLEYCILIVDTFDKAYWRKEGSKIMRIQIQKWGNSLAFRLPKVFAREAKVRQGSAVELSFAAGKLILTPVSKSSYTLKSLLAHVTRHNVHHEEDFGSSAGQEIW